MRCAAFTLVELLVVVTIVAVLATLLTAGLRTASEQGEATKCAANLRQLATAALTYAGEHDGAFPLAQDETNNVRWHGTRPLSGAQFDAAQGPLAPYLGRESRVKLCPTLRNVLTDHQTFEEGTGGYGYNAAYVGGTPGRPYQPERLVNIRRPAQTVLFTDTAFPRASGIQEYAYCEPFQWMDVTGRLRGRLYASVHFRHRGTANVAWCDGHVSAEHPSRIDHANKYGGDAKKNNIGWFGPTDNNGYWNPRYSDRE
ncbi:MAG: prepilin-type N-terminal cleavage/methylation domain-containing protein [Verrucomicrobiaceae bacterium]|nr:MAG: prepilin-type N-terminal cleavage/methylation domain-containing protein [Verrucomicrobiaceae bacterium]